MKDDREILHGIAMPATEKSPRKLYTRGMEDKLADVATAEQLKAWQEAGDIAGTWHAASKAAEKPKGKEK